MRSPLRARRRRDTLRRALRGDLERIVSRALEKSPEARYPTVGAFADDLRAVLEGRPIVGGTRGYRMRKFVRRHWLPLAAARPCCSSCSPAPAPSRSKRASARAQPNARCARRETTAAVKDFLLGLFAGADPRANAGKQVSVRELLDKGAEHIDKDLDAQPALQAELKATLGGIYSRLSLYPQAIKLDEEAIAGLDKTDDQAKLAALTELDLATSVRANGDRRAREDAARRCARSLRRTALAARPTRSSACYICGRSSRTARIVSTKRSPTRIAPKRSLARIWTSGNARRRAAREGLRAVGPARVQETPRPSSRKRSNPYEGRAQFQDGDRRDRQTLALIYSETGRYAESLDLNEQALANARSIMGERHTYVAQMIVSTANDLCHWVDTTEADATCARRSRHNTSFSARQPLSRRIAGCARRPCSSTAALRGSRADLCRRARRVDKALRRGLLVRSRRAQRSCDDRAVARQSRRCGEGDARGARRTRSRARKGHRDRRSAARRGGDVATASSTPRSRATRGVASRNGGFTASDRGSMPWRSAISARRSPMRDILTRRRRTCVPRSLITMASSERRSSTRRLDTPRAR